MQCVFKIKCRVWRDRLLVPAQWCCGNNKIGTNLKYSPLSSRECITDYNVYLCISMQSSAAREYNGLPDFVTAVSTVSSFCTAMKTYLFSRTFDIDNTRDTFDFVTCFCIAPCACTTSIWLCDDDDVYRMFSGLPSWILSCTVSKGHWRSLF